MKEINFTELKAMKLSDILRGQCLKVLGNEQTAFYVVVKPQGEMIARIEGILSMIDASRGF